MDCTSPLSLSLSLTHTIMVSSFLCFNFPDILVTKAGPGTIAKASICGLPCILSSFMPGQEEGNVPYVMDNGFGCYRGSPEGITDTVEEWFASTRAKGSMLERVLCTRGWDKNS